MLLEGLRLADPESDELLGFRGGDGDVHVAGVVTVVGFGGRFDVTARNLLLR